MDSVAQSVNGKKFGIPFYDGEWDSKRLAMALINAGGGALFPKFKGNVASRGTKITGALGLLAGKDLAFSSLSLPSRAEGWLDTATQVNKDQANQAKADTAAKNAVAEAIGNLGKALPWIAGAGGLGALGVGAIALKKYLKEKDKEEKAKLRLTLPGSPEDPDTRAELEMPVSVPEFSEAMQGDIGRGARRIARKNIKANTRKVDPYTNKLISAPMWEDRYGDEPVIDEEDLWKKKVEQQMKAAAAAPPPPGPPGPPPPPTPPGSVPMKQPVGQTPGPQLSTKYTQPIPTAETLRIMQKDLALIAKKLNARRERENTQNARRAAIA